MINCTRVIKVLNWSGTTTFHQRAVILQANSLRYFCDRYAHKLGEDEVPKKWHPHTAAIHADNAASRPEAFSTTSDIAPPLSVSTTFAAGVKVLHIDEPTHRTYNTNPCLRMRTNTKETAHVYSRESNPTRSRAEEVLGSIASDDVNEPAHAVLYSSGYVV